MDDAHEILQRVHRAADGDADALKGLLSELFPRLVRQIAHKRPTDLRAVFDAEDLVQEAFVEVVRHVHQFEPQGPDSFDRWVTTITLRRMRNVIAWHRAAKRGGQGGASPQTEESIIALLDQIAGSDTTPSRCVARQEALAAMQAAMTTLPQHYHEAIWRVAIQGQSAAEAAAAMCRTERAIHSLCQRARERLRDLLGDRWKYLSSSE